MRIERIIRAVAEAEGQSERERIALHIELIDEALRITTTSRFAALMEGAASAFDLHGLGMTRSIEKDKERAKLEELRGDLARKLAEIDRKPAPVRCSVCAELVLIPLRGITGAPLCGVCTLKDMGAVATLGMELLSGSAKKNDTEGNK